MVATGVVNKGPDLVIGQFFQIRKVQFEQILVLKIEMMKIITKRSIWRLNDAMHLSDLGVTKKILMLLINNKSVEKITPSIRSKMSSILVSFSPYIVSEFSRKPRPLEEIRRWKSVEYRQFILYTGIVLLKDFVSSDFYKHFLLLFVGYRIFVDSKVYNCSITYKCAEEMFEKFVKEFSSFYGREYLSYNIHNLLHVNECYEQYGNLMSYSAYSFENFLKTLKQNIKKPNQIEQQIYNKFINKAITINPTLDAIKVNKTTGNVKSYSINNFTFKTTSPDNICCLDKMTYIVINNIDTNGHIQGKKIKNVENFFVYPINSLDIGIGFVKCLDLEDVENTYSLENAIKIQMLPYKDGAVLIHLIK